MPRDDKLWAGWPYTRRVVEDLEEPAPEQEYALGYSLMRALAESDETLVEIAPGVWRHSTPES